MTHDLSLGVVKFTGGINEIAYKMPHKIEQYDSLSDLEKEHTIPVSLERGRKEKRSGVLCSILQELTNRIPYTNVFQENECEVFTDAGDDVRIIPDGVRRSIHRINESGYAVLIYWDEYAVLDRELDMPYSVG
ncbi:hypothetical protein Tco_1068168 [Tanacetum coccineum]|uniref:Uncharacterized protein n=1 Tax=Tanacetum coccineum TaxID=301880 RepID=A0ABQ5HF37_9ASTR